MNAGGYIAEVTCLSPNASEDDVNNFFALCGTIEHVEIVRAGEYACTAYVTFVTSHALETALLLTGATIVDQPVCITRWGNYENDYDLWNRSTWNIEDESYGSHAQAYKVVPSAGEAVTLAQDVVKTMVAKGYILGKDALWKAKALDESHGLSAAAVAKVAELSERIGLTDKIFAGVEAARYVDQRFNVTGNTKSAVCATGRTAVSAATAVVNSSYFARGALWVSGALSKAAQVTGDLGTRGLKNEKS